MTGASSTPFIVSAIQKGIITENVPEIYTALKKNHLPGGIMAKAGYEHDTGLGGGLDYYMQNGWVPYPIPEGQFGFHQDGAGLTLEYAYQDWTLAQLALKLGYEEDYAYFMNRSGNYRNVYDLETTWMRPRNVIGEWLTGFDPYSYRNGFIESNAAQATWFVPHDIPGLAALMGGEDEAAEKLNAQFETARRLGFTSGDAHAQEQHPEYSRVPINYGNQPSIQTAMVFHQLGRPGLSHYWSRAVVDSVFSGLAPGTGYNGDEDQGLMGSLAVLMKIGLFQLNGGTGENPVYYVGSPIFDKVTIQLHPEFYEGDVLTIETENNSADNVFVGKARINNAPLEDFTVTHAQITSGSHLSLEMVGNELE
jgi:predicted alpha-1,2-mannosidase